MFTEWISEPPPASAHAGHSVMRSGHARPVATFEVADPGHVVPLHRHDVDQLLMVVRGIVSCEVASGLWIVPPGCGLWIPAHAVHTMRSVGDVLIYCVYIETRRADQAGRLPAQCCTLGVSPLLRELVVETSRLTQQAVWSEADERVVLTFFDQLARAEPERLHVPMPTDARLRRIADRLVARPGDRTSLAGWASTLGMSVRTFTRLVTKETGMSFGRWKQQFQILFAMTRLDQGDTVQQVAFALGYESSSAFVAMFRRALGKPPRQFFASRTHGNDHRLISTPR